MMLESPTEDGIPSESNWHRIEMNLLIDSLHYHWRQRNDYFAGGNMFIYFSAEQVRNRDYRGPDFFVVTVMATAVHRAPDRLGGERPLSECHHRAGLSPSTIHADLGLKRTCTSGCFARRSISAMTPADLNLAGVESGRWRIPRPKPNAHGWLWSYETDAWLVVAGEFCACSRPGCVSMGRMGL